MGIHTIRSIPRAKQCPIWAAAFVAALLAGCSAAGPPGRALDTETVESAAIAAAAAAGAAITAVEVVDEDGGARILITGSSPLTWTSFRNGDGDLVIELPNASAGADLRGLELQEGLVKSARIDEEGEDGRLLTRLVVKTTAETEHSVVIDGSTLVVELDPVQPWEPEPVATIVSLTPARNVAPTPEPAIPSDQPRLGPAPEGVPATQLQGVDVSTDNSSTVVWVSGDGSFYYSSFALENPHRFVVDLIGVVNTSPVSTITVQGELVDGVRVAQFKPQPELVSRIVVDLLDKSVPEIEATSDGMRLTFYSDTAYGDAVADHQETVEEVTEIVAASAPMEEPIYDEPMDSGAADELAGVIEGEEEVFEAVEEVAAAEYAAEEILDDVVALEDGDVLGNGSVEDDMVFGIADEAMDSDDEEEFIAEMGGVEQANGSQEAGVDDLMFETETQVESESLPEPEMVIAQVAEEPMPEEEPWVAPAEDQAYEEPAYEEPAEVVEREVWEEPEHNEPVYEEPEYEDPTWNDTYEAPASEEALASEASLLDFAAVDLTSDEDGEQSFETRDITEISTEAYHGEPMSLTLRDGDIKDVLRSFAQISGLNVVVQPEVTGTVTVELTNVPWDQALDQILKINGLGYQLEGNIMRVAPVDVLRQEEEQKLELEAAKARSLPLKTMMRRVSYATASEIAGLLRSGGGASIMSARGSVVVDNRTNTLIIKELPSHINTVIAVIENLDIPEPQVMIEARIIETTKRFSRSLGVQWGFNGIADPRYGNTTDLQFPNRGSVDGGVNLLTGGNNGLLGITLGNVTGSFNIDMVLAAAESEGLINILSAPKIATLNNETASIQSGLQIPIQTISNNTVSVQFVNATLRLEVTPHVTAEGTVLMDIDIQKREPQLAFAVVGASNAPISTKDASTRVIVRDGGTTVIGGIYKVTSDQGEDRVPGLSNVPILKHLFKNKRRNDENEELLIFITPRVIRL
jgi:type IV pilus assembly protein PilQ